MRISFRPISDSASLVSASAHLALRGLGDVCSAATLGELAPALGYEAVDGSPTGDEELLPHALGPEEVSHDEDDTEIMKTILPALDDNLGSILTS